MSEEYRADRCPCGQRGCSSWHVWPVAAVQGVRFTEKQAKAVAALLNGLEEAERDAADADLNPTQRAALRAIREGGGLAVPGDTGWGTWKGRNGQPLVIIRTSQPNMLSRPVVGSHIYALEAAGRLRRLNLHMDRWRDTYEVVT